MRRPAPELPACYAMTIPGIEEIAAEEIRTTLRAEVKRIGRGLVVFRVAEIDSDILRLRTTEDLFLLAWGSDALSYRATDLEQIRKWTAHSANWEHLLRIHHAVRPKPKGKPTYHLVAQMHGEHGYRRVDALKSLAKGLSGKFPESWKPAEENASVEVWLTIEGNSAVCGLRLSDRTMRHRTYKMEHLPASLRPTVAAAMVRVAKIAPGNVIVDPMCGAGTILAEARLANIVSSPHDGSLERCQVFGGDGDLHALHASVANLRRWQEPALCCWNAERLPLGRDSVDRIVSNPPFGKQLSADEDVEALYRRMVQEYQRILRPGGRAVLLVGDLPALREACRKYGWKQEGQWRLRLLGQPAHLTVWRKPQELHILSGA